MIGAEIEIGRIRSIVRGLRVGASMERQCENHQHSSGGDKRSHLICDPKLGRTIVASQAYFRLAPSLYIKDYKM
jgi:hypothetical protein